MTSHALHVLGVRGEASAPFAVWFSERGWAVTGSDTSASGAPLPSDIRVLPWGSTLPPGTIVAYTPVIASSDPGILQKYETAGHRVLCRGTALRTLTDPEHELVVVAGSAGKSTTSHIVNHLAQHAGQDIGRVIHARTTNGLSGGHHSNTHRTILVEGQENDGMFDGDNISATLLTNSTGQHAEQYGDTFAVGVRVLQEKFHQLLQHTRGPRVLCTDDEGSRQLARRFPDAITYGTESLHTPRYLIENIRPGRRGVQFDLRDSERGDRWSRIHVPLLGTHIARNAGGALAFALAALDIPIELSGHALRNFCGVRGRFQRLGTAKGAALWYDFAHFPEEFLTAVESARHANPNGGRTVLACHVAGAKSITGRLSEFVGAMTTADAVVLIADELPAAQPGLQDARQLALLLQESISTTPSPRGDITPTEIIPPGASLADVLRPTDTCVITGKNMEYAIEHEPALTNGLALGHQA